MRTEMVFFKKIPKLPLTALVFYLTAIILWNMDLIPPPSDLVIFLERLFNNFGFFGLFIATLLEGVAYVGLYFPGSFIIALAVFFSDGSFKALFSISVIVALTLTLTSLINYWLGRYVFSGGVEKDELLKKSKIVTRGLLASMLHPNFLAFYFFNAGLKKQDPRKIAYVPVIMIPYGLLFAYVLSTFSVYARKTLESPFFVMSLIILWLVAAFIIDHKKRLKGSTFQTAP